MSFESRRRIVFSLVLFSLIFTLIMVPSVKAWSEWTQDDYEIFDLVDELENAEGEGVNFYSLLEIEPTATEKDINRAYRKKSLLLHPDKNPDEESKKKFARLGLIIAILRDAEKRERYDFFLRNGVPRWRGTGYYYSRHRPGLVSVLAFLAILFSTLHYLVMWMNFVIERRRIRYYVREAREVAWGRRMKRQDTRKKISVNDIPFVVEGDYVAVLGEDNEEYEMDEAEITVPQISDVFVFLPVRWAWSATVGRFFESKETERSNHEDKVGESILSNEKQTTQTVTGEHVKGRGGARQRMRGNRRTKTIK